MDIKTAKSLLEKLDLDSKSLEELTEKSVRRSLAKDIPRANLVEAVKYDIDSCVPFLASIKFLPDEVLKSLPNQYIPQLLDIMKDFEYTPSKEFVDGLISIDPKLFLTATQFFPTLGVSIPNIIELINQKDYKIAVKLIEENENLQREELLSKLLFEVELSDEINNKLIKNPRIVDLVFEVWKDGEFISGGKPSKLMTDVILLKKDDVQKRVLEKIRYNLYNIGDFENCKPNEKLFDFLLELNESMRAGHNTRYSGYNYAYRQRHSYSKKITIEYNEFMEDKDDFITDDLDLTDVPKGSKFRNNFLFNYPSEIEEDEVESFVSSIHRVNKKVLKSIFSMDSAIISGLFDNCDLKEKIERSLAPSEVRDLSLGNLSTQIVLLDNLSSKYTTSIKKKMNPNDIPERFNKRKKSYFKEAHDSIAKGDVDSFLKYTSGSYTLDKFIKDSWQSSKESIVLRYNYSSFFKTIDKELVLKLCDSRYIMKSIDIKVNLDIDEIDQLRKKLRDSSIIEKIADIDGLINKHEELGFSFHTVLDNYEEIILKDDFLFETALPHMIRNKDISIESFNLPMLCQRLDRETIAENFRVFGHCMEFEFLNIVDKNGDYLYSMSDIEKRIKGSIYAIEEKEFINNIFERDYDFAKNLYKAYLKNNKKLGEFLGKEIQHFRRNGRKKDYILKKMSVIDKNPESLINEVFENGGKYEDFKKLPLDWVKNLIKYSNNRLVKVDSISSYIIEEINSLLAAGVKVHISKLAYKGHCEYNLELAKIDKIIINESWNFEKNKENIKDILDAHPNSETETHYSNIARFLWEIGRISEEALTPILSRALDNSYIIHAQDLSLALDIGFQLDDELINKVFSCSDSECLKIVIDRIGSFEGYYIASSNRLDREFRDLFIEAGGEILSEEEYELKSVYDDLKKHGLSRPLKIEHAETDKKLEVIKYIENNIDERFREFNLARTDLTNLDVIYDYDRMKDLVVGDIDGVARILLVPGNIKKNRKIMSGILDIISMEGNRFTSKVSTLKNSIQNISEDIKLQLSDFINYEDHDNIEQSELIQNLDSDVLLEIEEGVQKVARINLPILKGKGKQSVMRFIKSACIREASYTRDIFGMIEQSIERWNAIELRKKNLEDENDTENLNLLTKALEDSREKILAAIKADVADHMHDRLVDALSVLQTDSLEALGQDKYKKLESNKKINEEFKFSLYFPKVRAELVSVGSVNGWCVNTHRGYGDGVIKKGNILVVICDSEVGTLEASLDSALALAHYIKNSDGSFRLEQIKWSKKKKDGKTNVDATRDFPYKKILDKINEHIASMKDTVSNMAA